MEDMEEQAIEIVSVTTTSVKCPCGKTTFQIPNVTNGYRTTCGFCGREFEIVTKVRISKPDKKKVYHMPY